MRACPHVFSLAIGLTAALACKSETSPSGADGDTGGSSTGIVVDECRVDGQENDDETDVDCGGGQCPACPDGGQCLLNSDCQSMSCQSDRCATPNCNDGGANQGESDIDCGGPCPPCGAGLGCVDGLDCQSGVCEGGVCSPPTCADGVENGSETDIDCGGSGCGSCPDGGDCSQNADCMSGYCMVGACTAKTCASDRDCTELDGPCTDGVCDLSSFVCEPMAINETLACDDGDPCTLMTTCTAARCTGGSPPDCTAFDDVCNLGTCNPADGSCMASPANAGGACDDGDPCTAGDACDEGACVDGDGPDIHLDEDFADDSLGWSLDTDWEIGPAMASPAGDVGGSDPAQDNTATADNGVAGVLIGGVISGSTPAIYLESPVIDLGTAPGDLQLRLFRWLNADVPGSTQETIEVYDGATWVLLYENPDAVTADAAWTEMTFDITAYKNADFRVRVGHDGGGNAPAVGSWNVDDMRIAPPTCP